MIIKKYILEIFKILYQIHTAHTLYEAFIADLLKSTDDSRKNKGQEITRGLKPSYVPLHKRTKLKYANNRDIKVLQFETKSQKDANKKYIQLIQIPEFDSLTELNSGASLQEKIELATKAGHVKVHCNCADFLYKGYEWMADAGDYGIVTQNKPPNIKNPQLEGSVCKHLYSVIYTIDNQIPNIVKDFETNI